MKGPPTPLSLDQRGVAALEFAIIAPMLLFFLGGIVDFGLVTAGQSQLANGLAQGVQYALQQGPSVTKANIQSMVQNGAIRAGLTPAVTVTFSPTIGPACYCVTNAPATLVTPYATMSGTFTCTGTCPAPEVAPGVFVTISASFVYQPLMPFYSQLANTAVSESVTVRLQ